MRPTVLVACVLVIYGLLVLCPSSPVPQKKAEAAGPVERVIRSTPIIRRMIGNTQENEVVRLVNQERQRRGLRPLSVNEKLMADARSWSNTQASRSRMYHSRMGYAENVAYGQPTPQSVVRDWMNSPGHRRNILAPSRSQIGVGMAYSSGGRPYWTQVFM